LLKEYIDTYWPDKNVMVVGDLNDNLTDEPENNVFQQILDDTDNYLFADFEIASGGVTNWSYPTYPSHLDHILITNELFDEYEDENSVVQTIKIDDFMPGGWDEYEEFVSDHRPVAFKFESDEGIGINDRLALKIKFSNYPNPFSGITCFTVNEVFENAEIEVYSLNGQKVFSKNIPDGQTSVVWNPKGLPDGIYLTRLISNKNEIAKTKIILTK